VVARVKIILPGLHFLSFRRTNRGPGTSTGLIRAARRLRTRLRQVLPCAVLRRASQAPSRPRLRPVPVACWASVGFATAFPGRPPLPRRSAMAKTGRRGDSRRTSEPQERPMGLSQAPRRHELLRRLIPEDEPQPVSRRRSEQALQSSKIRSVLAYFTSVGAERGICGRAHATVILSAWRRKSSRVGSTNGSIRRL
jgi:hypothetical protein